MLSATLWHGIGRQLRCPAGGWGRLAGHAMALVNREPNRLAIDALSVKPTDTVLELGFGPGRALKALSCLAPHGRILGIDRSPEMLALAAQTNRQAVAEGRMELRLGSFAALPWPEESVDKILAVNVAYFFDRSGDEFRQARSILRRGGTMVVFATHGSTMSHWRFAGSETHSLIDEDGLRALALASGFRSTEIVIDRADLSFGIRGLLAVLRKIDKKDR